MKLASIILAATTASFASVRAESAPTTQNKPAQPLYAAVFDFTDGSESLKGQGQSIGQLLNALLSTREGILLVERAELDKIFSEQQLGLSGNLTTAGAIKVGRLTGAQILVTGRVFTAGNKTYAVAKVISAETSRVYGATASYAPGGDIAAAASQLADKIAKIIAEKGDTLRSDSESYEQMIARLKKGLPEKLPKIYVHITEQHLRRAVPDPACETEIQKILGDCGFPLAETPDQADISITGEAFSQAATRRGNLVACRARAEIKITDTKSGKHLRPDRITTGAVDLAEEVAGKSALQKAGRILAQSFVARTKE
jgi:hypothetical protein